MKCRNCKNNTLLDDGVQFSWCEIRHDNLDIDEERYCEAFSQATNADSIRSMTDEELADFFERIIFCDGCFIYKNECGTEGYTCKQRIADWLKQERVE